MPTIPSYETEFWCRRQTDVLPQLNYLTDLALQIGHYEDYSAPDDFANHRANYPIGKTEYTVRLFTSKTYPTVDITTTNQLNQSWEDLPVAMSREYTFGSLPVRKFPFRLSRIRDYYHVRQDDEDVDLHAVYGGAFKTWLKRGIHSRVLELDSPPPPAKFDPQDCERLIDAVRWLGLYKRARREPAGRELAG